MRLIIEIGLDCDMKTGLFQDKKIKFLSTIIFLGVMALQYSRVYAQDPGQALKRAQELEKFGRVDEAREVYEQTYRQHPDNIVGFNRLKEFYIRIQEYDLACGLIKERQKRYPEDPSLTVSLAQVLYKMGEDKKAITLWHELLEKHPQKSSVVQLVASAMAMERLYDRAIEVYINGRNRIGRGDLFVFNLSNLYAAQMDFANAADELLLYLEFHPEHSSLIESQLKRFPKTSRVVREVVGRIERDIVSRPRDVNLRNVLVSYYLDTERYTEGLKAVIELEKFTDGKKQGDALFRFAQRVFLSGVPYEAERAYRVILEYYPWFRSKERVLFGLAQCYDAQEKYNKAVEGFHTVFKESQSTSIATQALFRKGIIQRDKLYDLSGARETFRLLRDRFPEAEKSTESLLELGNCAVAQGDLVEAEQIFEQVFGKTVKGKDSLWLKALIGLAEAAYFGGEFERTLYLLEELSNIKMQKTLMKNPVSNDGLRLRLFVSEHLRKYREPLRLFAWCEYLETQRKEIDALQVIDSLLSRWPKADIAADGFYKRGKILMRLGEYNRSLASFDSVVTIFPESIIADRAFERMGYVYELIGEKGNATITYDKLLKYYAQTLLADEVRKRIRSIEKEER